MPAIREKVQAAIRSVLGDLPLTDETTAADVPEWDSLRHMLIIAEIEDRCGITFISAEMEAPRCVGDLIALVERKAPFP